MVRMDKIMFQVLFKTGPQMNIMSFKAQLCCKNFPDIYEKNVLAINGGISRLNGVECAIHRDKPILNIIEQLPA